MSSPLEPERHQEEGHGSLSDERARAEQALRQSELRYRSLIDALEVSVCRWLPDTTLLFANEAYRAIFAIDGDPIGRMWLEFVPAATREQTAAFYRDLAASPATVTYEHPVLGSDGQMRYFQWIDSPIFDADQRLLEFQSVGVDVTERRQAEELSYAQRDLARIIGATRSSAEALTRCLAIGMRVTGMDCGGIYLFDPERRELQLVEHDGLSAEFVDQAARYPLEAPNVQMILAGTPFYFGDSDIQKQPLPSAEGLRCLSSTPILYQGQVVGCINLASHALGQVSPFARRALETIAADIGNIVVYLRTEEALRAEQLRVAALADTIPGTICTFMLSPGGVLSVPYASKAFEEIYGLSLDDVRASIAPLTARVSPDDIGRLLAAVEESARTLQPWRNEYRYQHPHKGEIWVEGLSMPVREADGSTLWYGFTTDITERKRAEQALRELNRTLEERVRVRTAEVQDIYENAPIGYVSLDAEGTVLMANQTLLGWMGYARQDMVGQPAVGFLSLESVAVFAEQFPILKRRGSVRDLEVEIIRKDGSLIPALISATALYDGRGDYLFGRVAIFDHSLRKRAEVALRESEEQNRLLFEESPDAVVLFSERGLPLQLNRAFEELSGYSAAQLLGRPLDESGLVTPEDLARLADAVVEHLRSTSSFAAVELRLRRADGSFRELGVRVFGLPIRGQQHYLATMRDITAEKQVAETLRQANAELARAARSKDEFLANMSHELRTPLNAILGLSESLLEAVRGPLNQGQQSMVRNIEASGRHLLALINDILDLSKVEASRLALQVEAVSVADVCQSSLLFVKEQALKKSLQLAFTLNDQLAEVEADPRRLKQMLVNLLSNAVKFTPSHGQVRLEVHVDPDAEQIRFAVRDTGIGIAAAELPLLFQPFKQLDSSLSRNHEGTGLGLALVRRLAELHGGGVTVESEPGQGSCFTISLPYRVPPQRAQVPGLAAEPGRPAERLGSALVVEDSENAAEQLARYLHEANVRVYVHPQGAGALDQAARLQPAVIFLDLLMADRSGWDVLAQLKGDPRTRAIPVVITSVMDERERGLAAGAADYIVKPFSRETLGQAIRDLAAGIARESRQALVIASRPAGPAADGPRILLAEDNELNILTVSEYLQTRGYTISVARNGREALSQIEQSRPELILMDIQMPEMDGLEAIQRLRALPAYQATPIIALTALAMPGDRERCLAAGANEYLTKPVSMKALAETIAALLGSDSRGRNG